jgi:TonB family protein
MSQTLRFPLPVKDVNLGFQSSFLKAVKGDEENAVLLVNDITDERLKGIAYVSLVKAILAKKPTVAKLKIQEKIVIVDEKGIRRSAVKAIMPVYPTDSLKKKISGVAVAEIQFNGEGNLTDVKILESPDSPIGKSVADAMRRWTFKPSQLEGKPISVRGKITFYFSINERGKGEVKNPKQFQ